MLQVARSPRAVIQALLSPQGRGTGGAQSSSLGHARQDPLQLKEEEEEMKQEPSGLGRGQLPGVLCVLTESLAIAAWLKKLPKTAVEGKSIPAGDHGQEPAMSPMASSQSHLVMGTPGPGGEGALSWLPH